MLAARTISPRVCGTTRSVRVNAFKPVKTQSLVAAVTAGSLLLVRSVNHQTRLLLAATLPTWCSSRTWFFTCLNTLQK